MNLHDLLAGIPLRGVRLDLEMEINSISMELEEIAPGTLFVDVTGERTLSALDRGAAAVVSTRTGPGVITVEQPWQVLAQLGSNWYCRPGGRMVLLAVAGSDTQLAAHLLQVMLERMSRSRVGMIAPDTGWINGVELLPGQRKPGGLCVQRLLRRMADEGCTHVILQLDEGALARRETAGLHMSIAALAQPVGRAQELDALLKQSDTVILNLDERDWEAYGAVLPEHPFTYSENKSRADLLARNLRLFPSHIEFEAVTVGQIQRIHLPAPGGFGLYHGLFALACGLCLGRELKWMAQVLRSVSGPGRQLEILPIPAAYTVVLDQAQTPRALEQLLTRARAFTAGRLICLLNCDGEGDAALRPVLGGVAEQLADRLILTCDRGETDRATQSIRAVVSGMGEWQRPCIVEPDRQKAIRGALEQAGPGDVIVLAGTPADRGPDERGIVFRYIQQHKRRQQGVSAGV